MLKKAAIIVVGSAAVILAASPLALADSFDHSPQCVSASQAVDNSVAQAATEGYTKANLTPYHGYLFRILTGQGSSAPRGAFDYVAKGEMIGGFAIVAYPASYGVSGVMTFLISHDGVVYQKDLGPATAQLASKMTRFDPGPGWHEVP